MKMSTRGRPRTPSPIFERKCKPHESSENLNWLSYQFSVMKDILKRKRDSLTNESLETIRLKIIEANETLEMGNRTAILDFLSFKTGAEFLASIPENFSCASDLLFFNEAFINRSNQCLKKWLDDNFQGRLCTVLQDGRKEVARDIRQPFAPVLAVPEIFQGQRLV